MEVYRSEDNLVAKYVHSDKSETTIKSVNSCGNIVNTITNTIEPIEIERNKFTVFISSSVGCPVGCRFCYLTNNKTLSYSKIDYLRIFENVREALWAEVSYNTTIRDKYIKFSFMGMGDAFLCRPYEIRNLTRSLCYEAIYTYGIKGIDGVDISTCIPKGTKKGWQHQYGMLNDELSIFLKNPSSIDRSNFRLFFSLHGVYPSTRRVIMPNTSYDWREKDLKDIIDFRDWYGADVIIHHILLDGINDGDHEVEKLVEVLQNKDIELRFLRYNGFKNSPYKESSKFDSIVKYCSDNLPRVKYQTSSGKGINAACGQFSYK